MFSGRWVSLHTDILFKYLCTFRADSKFGDELFYNCKINSSDVKASSEVLLKGLEHLGIFREDPRLKGVMKMLHKLNLTNGIGNGKLSKDQFTK